MPLQLVIVAALPAQAQSLAPAPLSLGRWRPRAPPFGDSGIQDSGFRGLFRVAGIVNALDFLPLWLTNSSRACRANIIIIIAAISIFGRLKVRRCRRGCRCPAGETRRKSLCIFPGHRRAPCRGFVKSVPKRDPPPVAAPPRWLFV